jgi:hypothetical protein
MAALETSVASLGLWVKAGVSLLIVLTALAIVLLVLLLHGR